MNLQEPPAGDAASADRIRLVLPAMAPYARVARLALTGLASRNGFTYDEVEDVRIAVGEVFGLLVADAEAGDEVELSCLVSTEVLDVEVRRTGDRPLAAVADLSRQILAAVTDEVVIDERASAVRIVKRQDPAA